MDTNTTATYTATGAAVMPLESITSNVSGKANVFLFAFFKDGLAYVRVIDAAGVQRNAYAKNYGITVRAIEESGDNITRYSEAMPRTIARWFKVDKSVANEMHDDTTGSTYERTIDWAGEHYTAHYNTANGLLTITQMSADEHTCNCEHVKHFPKSTDEDAQYEPREWADIPRDGHKYLGTFIARVTQHSDYVGTVCTDCFINCLGHAVSELNK